jgi:GTP-binding protein
VALAGLADVEIGSTVCDPERPRRSRDPRGGADGLGRLHGQQLALRRREGKYVTSRQLRDRLFKELESNVALRVEDTARPTR